MVFKSRRSPQEQRSEEAFLSRADELPNTAREALAPTAPEQPSSPERSGASSTPALASGDAMRGLDPAARPSVAFNLRLNEYQVELLRRSAARHRRSMQQQVLSILVAALEAETKIES
jgi:predicted HicB family RNase H-like nuclease